MKKVCASFILLLLFGTLVSYQNYVKYASVMNDFVLRVASSSDIDEESLVKILNDGDVGGSTLQRYGFVKSDISYIKALNKTYIQTLTLDSLLFGGLFLGGFIVYRNYRKKEKEKIDELISYLEKINRGIYDLELTCNEEGRVSKLKNEIYKTTITLRENAANLLKEKSIIKDNLANISHQLKTPLTSIMIMLDTLLEEDVPKSMRYEFLEDMRMQTENINFLIMALLKLSSFDASVVKFKKEKVYLVRLISDAVKAVDTLAKAKNVKVNFTGSNDAFIYADYKWEKEALSNIIKNAIEYSPENGVISISFIDIGYSVKIEISDEGPGIKDKDIKHIFDRFYKSNYKNNNFGIGLSLAKEIINKDNGSIVALNNKDKGSAFVIKFFKSEI